MGRAAGLRTAGRGVHLPLAVAAPGREGRDVGGPGRGRGSCAVPRLLLSGPGRTGGALILFKAVAGLRHAGPVPAQELGGRLHDDVRAPLDGPGQVGRGDGVVHHQGDADGVGGRRDRLDVEDVALGVGDRLAEEADETKRA